MPSTQFKNLGSVLQKYDLTTYKENFIVATSHPAPARLVEDIEFALKYIDYGSSEAAICESLIYPVLLQVWKGFLDTLFLYSHRSWNVDADLSGIPDYLVTAISKYGSPVIGTPVLVAIEAKKDNFEEGWAQCAAAMYAAQQSNNNKLLKIYGIVSNGEQWEVGYIKENTFVKNNIFFNVLDLDKLYTALYCILEDCRKQLSQNL
jgi:hypothetical protein